MASLPTSPSSHRLARLIFMERLTARPPLLSRPTSPSRPPLALAARSARRLPDRNPHWVSARISVLVVLFLTPCRKAGSIFCGPIAQPADANQLCARLLLTLHAGLCK